MFNKSNLLFKKTKNFIFYFFPNWYINYNVYIDCLIILSFIFTWSQKVKIDIILIPLIFIKEILLFWLFHFYFIVFKIKN